MKKQFVCFLSSLMLCIASLAAGGKEVAPLPLPSVQADKFLPYLDPRFKAFAQRFTPALLRYHAVHRVPAIQNNPQAFASAVQQSDGEEATVAKIYSAYGADFEGAMGALNELHNSLLQVMYAFPFLLDRPEEDVWQLLKDGLDKGMQNTEDAEWAGIQKELLAQAVGLLEDKRLGLVRPLAASAGLSLATLQVRPFDLTVGEVWYCIGRATGFGMGSMLTIGSLQTLAKQEGIQAVVGQVTRWLARRMGWIALGVALVDFGVCIYSETQD
jgi:hypothetical protein